MDIVHLTTGWQARLWRERGTPVPLFRDDAARPNVAYAAQKPFLRRFRSVFDRLWRHAAAGKCRRTGLLARRLSPTPLKNGENGRNGRVLAVGQRDELLVARHPGEAAVLPVGLGLLDALLGGRDEVPPDVARPIHRRAAQQHQLGA